MVKEVAFPRGGGGEPYGATAREETKKRSASDDLFKVHKKAGDEAKTSAKKSRRKKKKPGLGDDLEDEKVLIEGLTLATLPVGIVVMGCVQEVGDYQMKVSLPDGILCFVPITNISDPYTDLIERFTESPDKVTCPLKPQSMFEVGQSFPVKILEKQEDETWSSLIKIVGSINPRDVYQDINPTNFLNFCEKMLLSAAVKSVEDHGYIMDIGIGDDITAFLSADDAQPFLQSFRKGKAKTLTVGQVVFCGVVSFTGRSLRLTTRPKVVRKTRITGDDEKGIIPMSCLVAGLNITGRIMDSNSKGLEVMAANEFKGFVHKNYLSSVWDLPNKNYTIADLVTGVILYVNPATRFLSISLRHRPEPAEVAKMWSKLRVGQLIEGATVMGRDEQGNVTLKICDGLKAYAPKSQLTDDYIGIEDIVTIENQFPIGSKHKCRVKAIGYIDSCVKVTLKPSLIAMTSISVDDISIGSILKGKVNKLMAGGMVLQLGFRLKGFVPTIHLAETPNLIHPEKLYPLGKTVTCRVIRMDKSLDPPKIVVTCKKSLLDTKLSILDTFEKAIPDKETCGVIALMNANGLLVEFFNSVRGWVPSKYMSTYKIEYPEQVFKKGQIIRCSVVSSAPAQGKIILSLVSVKRSKQDVKESQSEAKVKIGQVLNKLKVEAKTEKGLELRLESMDLKVFLPTCHLSDAPQRCQQLWDSISEEDIIPGVVVFSVKATVVIVSRKYTFLEGAINESLVLDFESLSVDTIVPALVHNFTSYGMFLELMGSITGLTPRKEVVEGLLDHPTTSGFEVNQTVMARVTELILEPRRVSFSTKMSQVWNKTPDQAIRVLASYFHDMSVVRKHYRLRGTYVQKRLAKLSVGDIVTYRVVRIDVELGPVCDCTLFGSKKSIVGVVNEDILDTGKGLKVGATGEGAVLGVDLENEFIELSAGQKLVKQVQTALKTNAAAKLKVNQVLKCVAIKVTDNYVLVSLDNHGVGCFGYISTIRHLNDMSNIKHLFTVGQTYHMMVKKILEGEKPIIIGVLKQHDSKGEDIAKAIKLKRELVKGDVEGSLAKKAKKSPEKEKPQVVEKETEEPLAVAVDPVKAKSRPQAAGPPEKRCLPVSQGFVWDDKTATPSLNTLSAFNDVSSSSDDLDSEDDESDEADAEPRKRKTREERNAEARAAEEILRRKERLLIDKERPPETADDFERLILSSPNSSIVWLRYMAFHLEQAEVDKARVVGERALKSIGFREESEKFNVWLALLNLETLYGTQEELNEVLQRALQQNDQLKVYRHMATIYLKADKTESAEQLYNIMLKKFKQDKSVWIDVGMFYIQQKRLETARQLMQRSLSSLEKRDHIDVLSKFAQMEFKWGEAERGKTLFEEVLVSYPKRVDLWSIYVDMVLKYGNQGEKDNVKGDDEVQTRDPASIEATRNIFERVVTLKLPAKKMKTLFKKYLDFEAKYGNEHTVERVKQKALEYVESNPYLTK